MHLKIVKIRPRFSIFSLRSFLPRRLLVRASSPVLLAAGSLLAVSLCIAGLTDDLGEGGVSSISESDLRSTVAFLASEELQGRRPGSPFGRITSRYLAHRFELLGLEPAGDGDSYFQHFRFVRMELGEHNSLEIRLPDDASPMMPELFSEFCPAPLSARGPSHGPVVFAGYGIVAPELGYDDYDGLDVKDKVVMVIRHEPGEKDPESPFQGVVATEHSLAREKILRAQERGAAGVLLAPHVLNHTQRRGLKRLARFFWPEKGFTRRRYLEIWAEAVTIPVHYVSATLADSMLESQGTTLKEIQQKIDRDYRPQSLILEGVEARLESETAPHATEVRNVLATLPGVDPRLNQEVVVVGAHFDHIGADGGEVYYGADDNASGTAGLLEVAEAFARNAQGPRRSILFAGWDAEESGLLGSYYYVARPTYPLERTVAKFQMDMIGRDQEVPNSRDRRFMGLEQQSAEQNRNSVNVLGYSRSSDLQDRVRGANRRVGLELRFRYDDHPMSLIRRSDHWPFLAHGVPAALFHTGLHPDYHRTSDTVDKLNFAKMEKVTRLVYLTAWRTADEISRPRLIR